MRKDGDLSRQTRAMPKSTSTAQADGFEERALKGKSACFACRRLGMAVAGGDELGRL